MYTYHPVFNYLKKIINSKKYGEIKYVISNFRFPSLNIKDNRYKKNLGNGFFFDAASYLISLETYLFGKSKKKMSFKLEKIRREVDLRGFIF